MEWIIEEIGSGEWAVMRGEEVMVTLLDKELAEEIVGRINVAGLDHPVGQEITK